MSTSYFLYTEAYIDNKWVCINPTFEKEGKRRLAKTYESGSRSYFSQTADKIEEIGRRLRFDDLSAELQARYETCRDDEFVRILSAEVNIMRGCLPPGQAHEHHGIVLKDSVFAYESGDVEDLYELITPEEYAKLDEVGKQLYQYYEWDDPMGWFVHFKEILEHLHWQIHDWQNVYGDEAIKKCRVVALVF
ncbi:MAG: hypothetical protein CW335_01465 [Clostridiales bacterium]|nr:hypothetical protein [Clostridiales bacterium]